MLTLYRRHRAGCKSTARRAKCFCPIWVQGVLRDNPIRQSLDLTNWEAANKLMRDWEVFGKENLVSIGEAMDRFIAQRQADGLSPITLGKYKLMKRELIEFFGDVSLRSLKIEDMDRYRVSWKMANATARKKVERVRSFFKFCMTRKWIAENPAVALRPPKEKKVDCKPYDKDELEKISWAIPLFPAKGIYGEENRMRIRAFVTVLHWTGLRVSDVVKLKRDMIGTHITVRTEKNGKPVRLPVHPEMTKAVKELPAHGPYLFWSGEGNSRSCIGDWQRTLRRLADIAGVHIHAHRWRHTFATTLLSKGVPVSEVAAILGNSPRVVEKHYSQWIKSRQDALEDAVKLAWH